MDLTTRLQALERFAKMTDAQLQAALPSLPVDEQIAAILAKYVGGEMSRQYDGERSAPKAEARIAHFLTQRIRRLVGRDVLSGLGGAGEGVVLIAAERKRQVEAEGWTPEHDDAHRYGELVEAAECYLYTARTGQLHPPRGWPWEPSWWKPSDDPIRDLVKAGALIAAEIDRLQRAAAPSVGAPTREGA